LQTLQKYLKNSKQEFDAKNKHYSDTHKVKTH